MFCVNSLLIKTDVTCIKLINDNILIGIGSQLHVFKKNGHEPHKIYQIFDGHKIYGIELNSSRSHCLLYGANKLKLYHCNVIDNEVDFKEVASTDCVDWVLAAKWIDSNSRIATVLMPNIVLVWTNKLELSKKVLCEEKCMLYSAHIVNERWHELIILSGTVFSEILIWQPEGSNNKNPGAVLQQLKGHRGVIFSIDYNPNVGIICSTSDDRSARLWSIAHKDLLVELQQADVEIKLKHSLFGHDARVFRCKVLDNNVLTAGEDSVVNVWSLEGKLLRKILAYQGACVWSIDADEQSNQIITGGSNSGATLFPLKYHVRFKELLSAKGDILKKVVFLRNKDVVTISEMGVLKHYNTVENSWIDIANHNDLKSYALLEASPCKRLLALAGFHGTLHIYKLIDNSLQFLYSHEIADKSRIFALHWLSNTIFMVCSSEGLLSLYKLEDSLKLTKSMVLPLSKERWPTAACFCTDELIAVGDRKGNIYLYSLEHEHPIQTIWRAHNYLGITNLYYKDKILTSLGRNSIVKKYSFEATSKQFLQISSDKLPFTWLAAINEDTAYSLLLSFSGDEFIIWDYKGRRLLLQLPCGGGHRSWDFHAINNDAAFVFIKDKTIGAAYFQLNYLQPVDITEGYHINEINGLLCLELWHSDHQCLLISGGEDTTLRVSKLNYENEITFTKINVVKSHLSSIRFVKGHKLTNTSDESRYLLFSGGGRAHIIMWELCIAKDTIDIREKYSYYEPIQNTISEIRVMDACTIVAGDWVILVTVCSDGTLKLFLVDLKSNNYKMIVLGKLIYKLKCILKVSYMNIGNFNLVLSMATDGKIIFWDFTKFVHKIKKLTSTENNYNLNEELSSIKSFHDIEAHQSGINSFTYKVLNDHLCVFLSGGDDNAVVMNFLTIEMKYENITVKVLSRFEDVTSHCGQITGVFLTDKYFITTSIDQKLNIFNWKINKNRLECVFLQKYNLSVSDIQGIQCLDKSGVIYATVYGKGIEFCRINTQLEANENNSNRPYIL